MEPKWLPGAGVRRPDGIVVRIHHIRGYPSEGVVALNDNPNSSWGSEYSKEELELLPIGPVETTELEDGHIVAHLEPMHWYYSLATERLWSCTGDVHLHRQEDGFWLARWTHTVCRAYGTPGLVNSAELRTEGRSASLKITDLEAWLRWPCFWGAEHARLY